MGRVREKKRWRKEKKMERKKEKEEISPPSIVFCIRHCLHLTNKPARRDRYI
jgi:hypothetical protein